MLFNALTKCSTVSSNFINYAIHVNQFMWLNAEVEILKQKYRSFKAKKMITSIFELLFLFDVHGLHVMVFEDIMLERVEYYTSVLYYLVLQSQEEPVSFIWKRSEKVTKWQCSVIQFPIIFTFQSYFSWLNERWILPVNETIIHYFIVKLHIMYNSVCSYSEGHA